jgi:glycosyltransferase involved in cell wall biosynthesis
MKVSIITVAFNSAQTIARTLDSVASQSYGDIEHIIIDGGSNDGSLDIIKRLQLPSSRLLSEPDKGIYDAMNKGVRLATGDVIGFLNSDDWFADCDVVQRIAQAMAAESLDAVFADLEFVDMRKPDQVIRRYKSERFRPDNMASGWMPAHPTLYVRRQVFQVAGLFKTHYKIAGDFEFVARVMGKGQLRYRYIPEVWVTMMAGGVSTGGLRNTLLLNREVLQACRENGIPSNWFKLMGKYPYKLLEYIKR